MFSLWRMTILPAAEAPTFELPGIVFTGYAAPSRGSRDVCTWLITVEPGHVADQAHRLDRDEVFMVAAGTLRLGPDGDLLRPGDCAVIPAGEPIEVSNPGPEPARAYIAIGAGFSATMADGTVLDTPPWAR
jgi:mannose-6-phosphate isomerase-like protein (cupin superfamily)